MNLLETKELPSIRKNIFFNTVEVILQAAKLFDLFGRQKRPSTEK